MSWKEIYPPELGLRKKEITYSNGFYLFNI